jgi:transcription elongation factor/antiterminator RfaH
VESGGSSLREPQWYAVQTKPRQEERVRRWLQERTRLPLFLPRLEQIRRRRARRVSVIEPLFPSYLFVRMALEPEPWTAVRWTPGVRQIVGAGEQPSPVPAEAMRLLLERCGDDELVAWRPALRTGNVVRVLYGPFAGLEGILERPAGRSERVRVLLALLGGATPVELDVMDIEIVA